MSSVVEADCLTISEPSTSAEVRQELLPGDELLLVGLRSSEQQGIQSLGFAIDRLTCDVLKASIEVLVLNDVEEEVL